MQVLSLCNQINIAICSFFWEPEEEKKTAYAQQNKEEKGKKSEKKLPLILKANLGPYFPVSSKESNCTGVNKPFHSTAF